MAMQTPAPVEYSRATSVDDAITQMANLDGNARFLAGGHSLIPMMKLRLADPGHLIDINPLEPELNYIRQEGDEIRIGAMTRHATCSRATCSQADFPIFHEAEHVLADPVVRNRGTMGGSLCQADPAEDLSGVVTALKGMAVLRGPGGAERVVGMQEFHVGPYMTAVQPTELLIEVRFKVKPGGGSAHEKVERRAGDFAIVAASAALWIQGGRITDAGLACSAVGPTTMQITRAEEMMVGQAPTDELFAQAGAIASQDCSPSADGRGPIDYKRHVAGVLSKRALVKAAQRAPIGEPERCKFRCRSTARSTPTTWSRACCSCTTSARWPSSTGPTGVATRPTAASASCSWTASPSSPARPSPRMAEGHEITTVEGLEKNGVLDPIQQGFHEMHALQCGFCTPGMMVTGRALIDKHPNPTQMTDHEIREAISGGLCRCTGYVNIVKAIRWAAAYEAAAKTGGKY